MSIISKAWSTGSFANTEIFLATDFGVVADGTTDDTAASLAAITAAAQFQAATNKHVTIQFPAGRVVLTSPLPISARLNIIGAGWRQTEFTCNHTDIFLYSATFSGSTFTDNLDGALNLKVANSIRLEDFSVEHKGVITGNSPDTSTPWRGIIQLNNCSESVIRNVRVDTITDEFSSLVMRFSFTVIIDRFFTSQGSAHRGGKGIWLMSGCNSILLSQCRIFGGFETGINIDATAFDGIPAVGGIDSVTILECSVEQVDWEDADTQTSGGTGVGIKVGGSDLNERVSGVRILGCYVENNNIDIQLGTSTTGAIVENFLAEYVYHGESVASQHAYKFVNSIGHSIINPILGRFQLKELTLTGITGTPLPREEVTFVDRFGVTNTAHVISFDSGASKLTVKGLSGPIDPSSSVTTASMSAATLTNFNNVPFYGSPGNTHFDVDSGGKVLAGYFELRWYDAQDFWPFDVGLFNGNNVIKIIGANGTKEEYLSPQDANTIGQQIGASPIQRTRTSILTQAQVKAANTIFKVVVPNENYAQTLDMDINFLVESALTADPTIVHDSCSCKLRVIVNRSRAGADATVNITLIEALDGIETGSTATVPTVVENDFTFDGHQGTGELEIDINFDASDAAPSTDNRITVHGTSTRTGRMKVYANNS